jgi:hypothetical protein
MPGSGVPDKPLPPSFSIVVETVNLADASLGDLRRSLRSIEGQSPFVERALETVILDCGRADSAALARVCSEFPWARIEVVEPGIAYSDSKLEGAKRVRGEIVIFADADCVYEPGWLGGFLTAFERDREALVVAGETTTAIRGAYEMAMAMTYLFPRPSGDAELGRARHYEFNNVAFRRDFFLQYPPPSDRHVHRGAGFVHALQLRRIGATIWSQPRSRALHPVPQGPWAFLKEFIEMGEDSVTVARAARDLGLAPAAWSVSRVSRVWSKTWAALREDRRRFLLLPAALPIAALSVAIYLFGRFRQSASRSRRIDARQEALSDASG